ncbi:MAG: 30S ribosomal protein S6 [Ezakiella sp.]|nr:30S ribosomal protein S6 [Ezakiella sp.]MDD7471414.1 30S ribosomal protein S6 [Bacillota bacterium]MDY3922911.1 30S ribosomal protein S6 [Ezakiella sp.]
MNAYETMLVFRPDVEDEKREALIERLKGIVAKEDGKFSVDNWGLRKLAYEINDYPEGYYSVLEYETDPEEIKEVTRVCRISDVLLRYMTIAKED